MCLKPFVGIVLSMLVAATGAAQTSDAALVADIDKQGGHVVRDAKGNIVEVSLARTWATDADVERVAAIKTLKKLDLYHTLVTDKGYLQLKQALPGCVIQYSRDSARRRG